MRPPPGARARAIARWLFVESGPRRVRWRELASGALIIVVVAVLNTAWAHAGGYERLELADLDRLQRTSPRSAGNGIALVEIGEEEYRDVFGARSPLAPARVIDLVAAVCLFSPRAVAVDLVTSDWPAGLYQSAAEPRLHGCPVVWVEDVVGPAPDDADGRTVLRLGGALGSEPPPPGSCTAVAVAEPDHDGVVRRYARAYRVTRGHPPGTAETRPALVATLAAHARGEGCASTVPAEFLASEKIRYTIEPGARLPARFVLQGAGNTASVAFASARTLLRDRIVILGGTYRHARDVHRTPVGPRPGDLVIASALATELGAPIADVRWWQSLPIDLLVGLSIFVFLTWTRLRWPWATLSSLTLSAAAALLISWQLHRYLGYFLGVLGGLMGVVAAELLMVMQPRIREMWREWLHEFPRAEAEPRGATQPRPAAPADAPALPHS